MSAPSLRLSFSFYFSSTFSELCLVCCLVFQSFFPQSFLDIPSFFPQTFYFMLPLLTLLLFPSLCFFLPSLFPPVITLSFFILLLIFSLISFIPLSVINFLSSFSFFNFFFFVFFYFSFYLFLFYLSFSVPFSPPGSCFSFPILALSLSSFLSATCFLHFLSCSCHYSNYFLSSFFLS